MERSRALVALILAVALLGASCAGTTGGSDGDRLRIVAAFYPLAYAAQAIGGDRVEVDDLTPAGAEPHDVELGPDALVLIEDADLVVTIGGGFQPAVDQAVRRARVVVDALSLPTADPQDPHVWLDPIAMADLGGLIADGLSDLDPDRAADYERALEDFTETMLGIDRRYREGLAVCERRTIVVAHDAFGYLAERYDLEQHSIAGISPSSEPDPRRLARLAELVEQEGVTTVFTETLVDPSVAQTLAREAGIGVDVLDPIEGLTSEQIRAGEDYPSVMLANLEALRRALDCS